MTIFPIKINFMSPKLTHLNFTINPSDYKINKIRAMVVSETEMKKNINWLLSGNKYVKIYKRHSQNVVSILGEPKELEKIMSLLFLFLKVWKKARIKKCECNTQQTEYNYLLRLFCFIFFHLLRYFRSLFFLDCVYTEEFDGEH